MERAELKKRAREGDHEEQQEYYSSKKNVKKQDLEGVDLKDENSSTTKTTWDSSLPLDGGVFDFPWLKDGMITKSEEDWRFEDTFSSSLYEYETSAAAAAGSIEFSGQCLCQTPEALIDFPEEKFDENLWRPLEVDGLEMENVDCVWSSLLSQQPLQ